MKKFHFRRNNSGFVLVITLLVLGILIVLGYAFSTSANVAFQSAQNARKGVECEESLISGLQYAVAVLSGDGEGLSDSLEDSWASEDHRLQIGALAIDVTISDENRRLNVNLAALTPSETSDVPDLRPALKTLVSEAGGESEDAQAIIAWLDPNTPGIHDDIAPKQPVLSLEALRAIPDLNPRVFSGAEERPRLDDQLATHPAMINVNTATELVLRALWPDGSVAQEIIQKRESTPFTNRTELRTFLESHFDEADAASWESVLDVSSDYFTVTVRAPEEAYRNTLIALVRRNGEDVRVLLNHYTTEEVEP